MKLIDFYFLKLFLGVKILESIYNEFDLFIWTKQEKDNNNYFKKNFERTLLKCIKLQVSNVFFIKLNSFSP